MTDLMVIREVKQQTLFSNQYFFTLDYSHHAAAAAAAPHSPVVHPSHLGIVPSRLSASAFVFFVVLLLTSLNVVSCDETTVAPPPALTSTTAAPTVRTPAPTVAPNSTSTTSAPSSVLDLQPSASSNPIVLSIVGSVSGVIIFSAGGWLYYRISKSPSEEIAPDEDDGTTATPMLEEGIVLGDEDPDILMLGGGGGSYDRGGTSVEKDKQRVDAAETFDLGPAPREDGNVDDDDVDDERRRPTTTTTKKGKYKTGAKKPAVAVAGASDAT